MQNLHILLTNIDLNPVRAQSTPSGFTYDMQHGAWLSENDHSLLVEHADFTAVASKKKDIETGEDQK